RRRAGLAGPCQLDRQYGRGHRERSVGAARARSRRSSAEMWRSARSRGESSRRGPAMTTIDGTQWKGKRIGVVMGGPSSEREVSLRTGAGVLDALVQRGYDAVAIDWTGDRSLVA